MWIDYCNALQQSNWVVVTKCTSACLQLKSLQWIKTEQSVHITHFDANLTQFKLPICQLTCTTEFVRGETVNSFVFQMNWLDTSWSWVGETSSAEPVSKPCHVTVAVEWVGDQVEACEAGQLIKCSRGHTTDLVTVQWQRLEIVQTTKHGSVHNRNLILRQQAEINKTFLIDC